MVDNLLAPAASPNARAVGSLTVLPPLALLEAAQASARDLRLVMREPASGRVVVVLLHGGRPTMVFSPGDGRSVGELLVAAGRLDRATLAGLLLARTRAQSSLESLLAERTLIPASELQRFFDFQARARLLDALAWQDGSFELETHDGALTEQRVELPSLASLALRARARAEALPRLTAGLPAPPEHVLVRRRRGGAPPSGGLAAEIWACLCEPLLLPQLGARLLADDDLILAAVRDLEREKAAVVQPRAALVPAPAPSGYPPSTIELLERIAQARGGSSRLAAVWAVVVARDPADAVAFVQRLGGEPSAAPSGEEAAAPSMLASSTVHLSPLHRLCLVALHPTALAPAALAGVLSRCDALCLLRTHEDDGEATALDEALLGVTSRTGSAPRMRLGIELDARPRPWGDLPDAILRIARWREREPAWLVEHLVEGLFAAASSASVITAD